MLINIRVTIETVRELCTIMNSTLQPIRPSSGGNSWYSKWARYTGINTKIRIKSPTARFRLNKFVTLVIRPFRKIAANKSRFPRAPKTNTNESHIDVAMCWTSSSECGEFLLLLIFGYRLRETIENYSRWNENYLFGRWNVFSCNIIKI